MTTLPVNTPHRARRTRRITGNSQAALTIDETVGSFFRCQLVEPTDIDRRDSDVSPRDNAPRYRLQADSAGLSPAPALSPGDRVEVAGFRLTTTTFEVVAPTRSLGAGVEVELLPIDTLYPASATLEELGGADLAPEVGVAIWPATADETAHDFGVRIDFRGDAPLDEATALLAASNRQLAIGSRTFKIAGAVQHYDSRHVELGLVESRAG